MSNTLSYIIQINSNFDKVNANFNKFSNNVLTGVDKIQSKFNSVSMNAFIQNVNSAADGLTNLNEPGLKLSSRLAELTAITGVAGDELKQIEGYARENAKTFGGSAADGVESYKLLLSKLSPELAKQPKALKEMGNSVSVLSKQMGGDNAAAANVLTTAMNQYGVSLDDPTKASQDMISMMNIMSKSAAEGSAELPQIQQALENAGMGAKQANVSFAETNAAIQILDKAGKKGAEGGIALRNVMVKLSQGEYIPPEYQKQLKDLGVEVMDLADKNKPLSERLKALQPAMKDGALLSAWLGEGADSATKALMEQIPTLETLTKKVQNSNDAYRQAEEVMKAPEEKNKRLRAEIDNFKISLFNGTNGLIAYTSEIGNVARDVSNLMPILSGVGQAYKYVTNAEKMQTLWTNISNVAMKAKAVSTAILSTVLGVLTGKITFASIATGVWTAAQTALNFVMNLNPIGLIVIAIAAMVAMIVVAINHYDKWGSAILFLMGPFGGLINVIMSVKDHWDSIVNAFNSDGIVGGLKRIGLVLLDAVMKPLQQILEVVAKVDPTGLAQKGLDKIKAFRTANDLVTDGEKAPLKAKTTADKAIIKSPKVPGASASSTPKLTGGDSKMKKSNEAVATGGTKHNYITIKIEQLNGLRADNVSGGKETAKQAGEGIADELLRVIALAGSATG